MMMIESFSSKVTFIIFLEERMEKKSITTRATSEGEKKGENNKK